MLEAGAGCALFVVGEAESCGATALCLVLDGLGLVASKEVD